MQPFFIVHFCFIFVFWFTNIPVLAYVNVISCLLYVIIYALYRKNKLGFVFALMTVEVLFHAAMCSEYLGDAGFTEALLFLPLLFFIHPSSLEKKILYFVLIISVYVALRYNDQFHEPLYAIDDVLLKSYALGTSILIIIIDCYIAYFAYKIIEVQKKTLILTVNKLYKS